VTLKILQVVLLLRLEDVFRDFTIICTQNLYKISKFMTLACAFITFCHPAKMHPNWIFKFFVQNSFLFKIRNTQGCFSFKSFTYVRSIKWSSWYTILATIPMIRINRFHNLITKYGSRPVSCNLPRILSPFSRQALNL
jgi:hypothetical protein